VQSGTAEVQGARLYYEVAGRGHPLVLIHAGIADCRMWDDQFEVFARRFRVVRYDVRGFGRSDMPPGPFSHQADLAGLLGHLDLGRAYVLGVSMGGLIAIDFTIERPEMVAALIPVASALSGSKPSDGLLAQWATVEEVAEKDGDVPRAVELELRMWVDGPRRTPDQVDPAVRERVREMNTAVFMRALRPEGTPVPLDPPAIDRLGEIVVPTLIIVGDGDQPDIVATADLLAQGIAGARQVVMPGLAHVPNMERPAEFNSIVQEFLGSL
jgi:pimeloyl-ACP methyl ester carboxylesterase